MIKISIQYFGGRGGGGSGGARGGGRAGGGGGAASSSQDSSMVKDYRNISYGNAEKLFDAPVGTQIRISNHSEGDYIGELTRTESGWVGSQQHSSSYRTPRDNATAKGFASQVVGTDVKVTRRSTPQSNPAAAAVGTKLSMGGYTYTKNSSGTWTTYKNGKRYPNRTNADIKRVFT